MKKRRKTIYFFKLDGDGFVAEWLVLGEYRGWGE